MTIEEMNGKQEYGGQKRFFAMHDGRNIENPTRKKARRQVSPEDSANSFGNQNFDQRIFIDCNRFNLALEIPGLRDSVA